jgi:tripartite-type tricarboxylate transporter receptor subunit TctC
MTRLCSILRAALTVLCFALPTASFSQEYPNRPIRLIVPYPPGSGTDIVGRLLAHRMSEQLGQQVFVDNRPGAGATIGTNVVAKAEADGYTILMADLGPLAIAPSYYRQLPYDPIKELAPISQVAVLPFLLVVHPSVPARNVPELIALAKSKPGELNYASVGNGTAVHLATELFKQIAGVDIVHVPYKGSAPALTDLIAGRTSMMFVNVLSARSFLQSGQLRALAIGTPQRSAAMPDIPAVTEYALPGFQAVVWFGLLAPVQTPQEIIDRLNPVVVRILETPDFKQKLAEQGAEAVASSPRDFVAHIKAEIDKWAQVIRVSGVRLE